MKHLLSILEFNKYHKDIILENGNNFTIAYELELMSKKPFSNFKDLDKYFRSFYQPLITKYDMVTEYDETLDSNLTKDLDYEIDLYEYYDLDSELDIMDMDMNVGLSRIKGIEMKNKTHFNNITESFLFLDDFYEVLNNKKFKQTHKTGTHINIGYNNENNWNLLKGYLLLNEDFAFKGYEKRKNSEWTKSYKNRFINDVKKYLTKNYNNVINALDIKENLAVIEKDLNIIMKNIFKDIDEKTVGFNINKLKHNYIEFRYAGGSTTKEVLKEQTLHYCNIVYLCKDISYRRKEYINKLVNFLTNINLN